MPRTKGKSAKDKMLRQTKWKVKMFQAGNCINCGNPRGNSPYKRRCMDCALTERKRHQKKYELEPWKAGKRGRPPLVRIDTLP